MGGLKGKKLRRVGLAALLVGAALSLSGCWGRVYYNTPERNTLVIPQNVSNQIIWNCGGASLCALDTVRALCGAFPLPNLTYSQCGSFTWPDHIEDMKGAIAAVTGPNADCLAVTMSTDPNYFDWFGMPLNARCTPRF